MAGRLDGKVAVITGATSGIGRRTAEVFVEHGARVVLAGRRTDLGEEIAAGLGDNACFVRADVTVEDDVAAMIGLAVERWGRLDCLFNNAGGPAPVGSIEGVPLDGFRAAFEVLVSGVMLGMKHAAPIMKKQGAGSIINNGSVAAHRAGLSSSMSYGAFKAAVNHLTRCVAMELGEAGVRVNSISPGGIATGIFGKAAGLDQAAADRSAEVAKQALATLQPIPRAGLPDDIANAALFLASDESTFVNGHDLVVDGGLIAGRRFSESEASRKALFAALAGNTA